VLRPCLDWTERREHLAGVAADELFSTFHRKCWIERSPGSRVVRMTPEGSEALTGVLAAG
jgi:hypothetical protein